MSCSDRWLCLVDDPRSGGENMRIDLELLRRVQEAPGPLTLIRFYRWRQPTISLGKHQQAARAVDVAACRSMGVPLVQRPTGGRAVLHDRELTYAIASNDATHFPIDSITGTYRLIAEALQAGLRRGGIEVSLAAARPGSRGADRSRSHCFSSPSRYELLSADGRKVCGSAQRRLKRGFLQHGSLPLEIDYATMARALGTAPEELESVMVSLSEAAGREIDFSALTGSLQEGFEARFGVVIATFRGEENSFFSSICNSSRSIASPEMSML